MINREITPYRIVTLKGSFITLYLQVLENTCKSRKKLTIISEKSTVV